MTQAIQGKPTFGVVVIGRNEGERLRVCIDSVIDAARFVIYVDSGSSDSSVKMAREKGIEVVGLDLTLPFTAARARNVGWQRLRQIAPDIIYVQFVDGDCEVVDGWLETAANFLDAHREVVVTCGRRRERYPDVSIYNILCDIEWDTPVGESLACGGDAMIRLEALVAVNGYRSDLIAGEEPELCVRLRASGGKVWRLGEEMTLHDAAMTRFGQWWNRNRRAGYAFACGAWLHGAPPERHHVAETKRALIWGVVLPILVIGLSVVYPYCLLLLAIYPLQVIRIATRDKCFQGVKWRRAFYLVLGRFPEGLGLLSFIFDKIMGKRSVLIEYK